MPYATQQDLVDRFGATELVQLSDRADPPSGAVDAAVVAKAIADAGELIDGYLAARYALPIPAPVPALLSDLCGVIARYKLHINEPPERVRKDYEDALKRLREISDGTIILQVAGAQSAEISADDGPAIAGPERVFSRDTMKGL